MRCNKPILILFILLVSFMGIPLHAQQEVMTGEDYMKEGDYNRALDAFLKEYPAHSKDIKLNYNIGVCYLEVNRDRSLAISYLLNVYRQDKTFGDVQLLLGEACMYHYEFENAINYLAAYRAITSSKNYDMVDHLVENCENAKVLMRNPVNVTFTNLGKEVNSKFPDYFPFVTGDGGTLYYTTRREGGTSRNMRSWAGYATSDVYFSKLRNGIWSKGKSVGPVINTSGDEECVGLTPDGKNMVLFLSNDLFVGDIYYSSMGKSKSFPKPAEFDPPVNSDDIEYEGCLSSDGNTIILTSNRKGGFGGNDIWIIRKLPNGTWGTPLNAGTNINTEYDEAFPVYDEKNGILYFASQGHVNMGGFDIFRSRFDASSNTFGPAENIGYPINTPEDNMEFTLAANGRDGYVSMWRPEGMGDLDIYLVTFNYVAQPLTVIHGKVTTADSARISEEIFVVLTNSATHLPEDSGKVNLDNGHYVIAVPAGKYLLTIRSEKYEAASVPIIVYDRAEYVFEIEKNVILLKPGIPVVPSPPKGK